MLVARLREVWRWRLFVDVGNKEKREEGRMMPTNGFIRKRDNRNLMLANCDIWMVNAHGDMGRKRITLKAMCDLNMPFGGFPWLDVN